jgi:hypothetical protein
MLLVLLLESLLKGVQYHAVCPLDLAISFGMGNRDIFDRDATLLAEILEITTGERRA